MSTVVVVAVLRAVFFCCGLCVVPCRTGASDPAKRPAAKKPVSFSLHVSMPGVNLGEVDWKGSDAQEQRPMSHGQTASFNIPCMTALSGPKVHHGKETCCLDALPVVVRNEEIRSRMVAIRRAKIIDDRFALSCAGGKTCMA
ncbi:hypothetical protein N658DRAFT_244915 [Parathielavia hyrcaniae]|uniref:Secreted protein n=1 Tax=Parathielavia hyrcaniae TaxID=113614 RepID=A0AAN6T4W1_9PEZI|nr:hypothetical protein N658DRAFT_244915 [Parathielavia hyrcaniae]